MFKNLNEMRKKMAAKKEEMRSLIMQAQSEKRGFSADEESKFGSLESEADALEAEIKLEERSQKLAMEGGHKENEERDQIETTKEYRSAYEKYLKYGRNADFTDEERQAFKAKQQEARSMVEGDKTAGGILVPEDDSKEIMLQKKSKRSIRNLVGVKPVGTLSGSRPKRRGTDLKLKNYDEKSPIGKEGTPEYTEVKYKVHKYGGIFEVTNELLADSAVNISEELRDWYTEASLNTENDEVFNGPGGEDSAEGIFVTSSYRTVPSPAQIDIKTLRKVKNMVDASYRGGAKWIMNTAATEALADMKYADGKSVLVPDPTQADVFTLFSYPVEVYDDITTTAGKTKIAFGNFEVGYYFFDRKVLEAKTTDEGGDAFENDTTLTRVIQRFDGKPANEDAIVILTGLSVEA
ncbi:phage major capsid protein [Paenibacillus odorifer]|uniref:phage major capsid protein n=1 Tax=Paenibacillus odorifer TaxID=189426 RepID=UPI0009D66D9F|nr:phage major capsid protein [Paenibacillus odorifer]